MRETETEGVELAAYRLKGVAYSWFELWEDSREEGRPPARWSKFADAFIDHFLPAETRAAWAAEFENLRQGNRSVWEYHIEFARLSKYAIHILPTMEARMVAFAQATENRKLKNKMEREGNSKARTTGNMGESLGGGRLAFKGGSLGPSQSVAQSSASAPPSGPSQQQWSRFRPDQGNRGSHQRGRSRERFQQQHRSPCPRCGKMHLGFCYMELPIFYGCGMRGHIQRHCHVSRRGAGMGVAQPTSPAAATSSAPSPARDELIGIPTDREIDFGIDVMPDALSRKSMGSLAHLGAYQRSLARGVYQLASLGVRLADSSEGGVII
uniref:Uncharacterized protein LOC104237577 n=1 Tax=Nicotiana sylvestris TaxID=4096 RepID=A0A1U7XDB7_NICSY|nr:PREDICTED: uncharacterized protein LOC104237577 [Nicotiana sylvestris]